MSRHAAAAAHARRLAALSTTGAGRRCAAPRASEGGLTWPNA
ncbi:hypothetical protein BURPS406E_G0721 [Burkholderia pseudomallei 406e]|nr:hypothetical protein BURPS668_A1656 [Burkholderia pseudomallei 668]EBA45312.1 hypothetical protein BURPS305_0803 [Burkholderia pseudomallei 305]EDO87099.1 hypothetical protein BURPS406E_G0721 [Burkholderia pseudomallei 406e]EEC38508.1 conserved hypothetical protein [Burkholderia pseudomallei 576]